MRLDIIAAQLQSEKQLVSFTAHGRSMEPRLPDGAWVTVGVFPADAMPEKGDVVLAKVRGVWRLHLVSAVEGERVQISNNKGHVNGWTHRSNIVGYLHSWTKTKEPA